MNSTCGGERTHIFRRRFLQYNFVDTAKSPDWRGAQAAMVAAQQDLVKVFVGQIPKTFEEEDIREVTAAFAALCRPCCWRFH